jgi:hypothetical protein
MFINSQPFEENLMSSSRTPPRTSFDESKLAPKLPPGSGFARTSPAVPRWARRLAFTVAFSLAVMVMAFPSVSVGAIPQATPSATHDASHAATTAAVASPRSAAPAAITRGGLPGANPSGEKPFNAAFGTQIALHQSPFLAFDNATAHGLGLPLKAASPAPAAPRPSYYIATGAFYGYVYNRETDLPIDGATVQAFGADGQDCPATTCLPVSSSSNGSFTAYGPVGFDYVQATTDWYLSNLTYATAGNGTRVNVGTIFEVEAAIGVGIVKADVPKTYSPLSGIIVTDATVDSSTLLSPSGTSLNNGSFRVAIADSPSIVTFTPPYGLWLANTTWTNGTPGQIVNLGTIYLERMAEVKVNVTDAVTGGPLLAGNQGSLQICSLTNGCGATQQGNLVTAGNGPHGVTVLEAAAQPGASYAVIQVTDYAQATVVIGDIPPYAGGVFWMNPVNLTPDGGVLVNVGLTANDYYANTKAPVHTGLWTISSCTQDGYNFNSVTPTFNTSSNTCATAGCQAIGSSIDMIAAPLRNEITIQPDATGLCGMGNPTWPIPGYSFLGDVPDIPVWENQTWVNVTPRLNTEFGWMNFTAGTYVHGNVTIQGTTGAPADFSVTVSSINYPTVAPTYSWDRLTSSWATWACGPDPSSGVAFCAPALPGPDLVTVSSNLYPNNYTWVSVPEAFVGTPQQIFLAQPQNQMDGNINLTAGGFILGNVTQSGTNFGLPLASLEVCSVSPTYPVACQNGAASLKGQFDFPAPLGWDYVKASASGYEPDYVWAYVNSSQQEVYIGNLGLQPLATLQGRVVDPEGNAVLGATAKVCQLTDTSSTCPNLGAGRVSSDGVYLGQVIGGWLPMSTYRVVVTAAGYSTDWAWVNATVGQETNISTLTLFPSGSNGSDAEPVLAGARSAGTSNNTQISTWLAGRLVDNVTQLGVQTSNYAACPAQGGTCFQPVGGSNTGGFFNLTIPAGLYYLNITAAGYEPSSVYFNSSGAGYLNMGEVALQPLPWVFGNVTINPWNLIYVQLSATVTDSFQMGPEALVKVCSTGLLCAQQVGPSSDVSPTGQFQVWGVPGLADSVQVAPSATGISTSATGGFNSNSTTVTIAPTQLTASIPGTIKLDVFASLSFTVWNNLSFLPNSGALTPLPVRYAGVSASTIGNFTGTASWSANGSGGVTFFLPPGNPANKTSYTANVPTAWETQVLKFSGQLVMGGSYQTDPLSLLHFGWETGTIVTANTYQAASYLPVSASSIPMGSTLIYTSSAVTNGGGFFNVSAAASPSVHFSIGPGNDYNNTSFYAPVNDSATSSYNSSALTTGNITIDHWGYAASTQVNYSQFPTITTVIDPVKDLPLPGVSLTVSTVGDLEASTTDLATSNVGGQFLVDAPPGNDWANYSRAVYEPNATRLKIEAGEISTVPLVNMTGDGVVSGIVLSKPGDVPVVGANITDCLGGQRVCGMVQTNGTGQFWVNATPGLNFLNVSAAGLISPGPTLANVCSDCYVGLTPIPVYQPAYISGTVLGLPAGFPVVGANVSACSPVGGSPTGPCLYSVQSTKSGSFLMIVPAGSYILAVSDLNYNSTYLTVDVAAGEHVNVGSVFLEAFGSVVGAVYDNTTTVPISGAQVYACPVWSGGTCVGASTDIGGHYAFAGAPGAYVVTISASGYADLLLNVAVVGGRTTLAPTAFLVRLGTDTSYPVSGTVLADGAGLSGAVVAAEVGGVVAGSAQTDSSGAFTLTVLYGTYLLVVTASGEATLTLPVVVHGPVSGLTLTLSAQTYAVTGRVTDGLTGSSLSGVDIEEAGVVLATTGSDGTYSLELANGTTQLTAVYDGPLPVSYSDVDVAISMNGAPVVRNIAMFPPETNVFGLVVNAASGAPLPGAGVVIVGVASDGKKVSESFQSSGSGAFQIQLPEGSYTLTGTYGGYSNASVTVTPKGSAATQVVVPMQSLPTPTTNAAPAASMEWVGIGIVVGLVAAISIVAIVLSLRRTGRLGGRAPPAGGKE